MLARSEPLFPGWFALRSWCGAFRSVAALVGLMTTASRRPRALPCDKHPVLVAFISWDLHHRPAEPVPADPGSVPDLSTRSAPPESPPSQRPWRLYLDRFGLLQAIGGLVLGLIALFTSYDHLSLAGLTIPIQQQWGLVCIAASLATVVVDAELASRSRLRAADEAIRAAQDAARAANEAAEERDRADQERNRAAEARKRQAESFERLDQAALLSGRFQLDPNPTNRARFQLFLTLLAQTALEGPKP